MIFNSIAFFLGTVLLQFFSYLPNSNWAIIFIILSAVILFYFYSIHLIKYAAIFCIGFSWCIIFANHQLSWRFPQELENKTITIRGIVVSIPEKEKSKISFLFAPKLIKTENGIIHPKGLVNLSWKESEKHIHAGDEWEFEVRMKHIRSNLNPGGFDYEAWSFQEGIRATGYVYHHAQFFSHHWYHYPLNRIREYIDEKIQKNLPQSKTSVWIPALALGIRQGIADENWQVLRATGTNHLMAIAGLHIGFMSSFVYALINMLWRRIPRAALFIPAQQMAGIAALSIGIIYSALAGFSLPTQRACLMLSVFMLVELRKKCIPTWHAWGLAILIVLLINPLSVLTETFWLSFGSVAFIIYGISGRLKSHGLWWKYGRIQWVLTIGLIPLSIWLFKESTLVGFIANSIAIPVVGFVIVPLVLLGTFTVIISGKLGGFILFVADKLLGILWIILTYFSHLSWSSWSHSVPNVFILLLACLGIILLLAPLGFPTRGLGCVLLLPFVLFQSPKPVKGDAWLTLLDVGQGLSAVIQTEHHNLIYDTGAKMGEHLDMGKSVLIPFLQHENIKKIDMLVVSHKDNDHSGGAGSLLDALQVNEVKSSSPELFPNAIASYCLQNQAWEWDGVRFEFLYPSIDDLGLDNDSSCVLKVTTKSHQLLLPGDIEKRAELALVNRNSYALASDVLIAPHHGSKTSAEKSFLDSVNPKFLLIPVGYKNRYHLPNEGVVNQYLQKGVRVFDSINSGAIQIKLTLGSIEPLSYRQSKLRYWNDKVI